MRWHFIPTRGAVLALLSLGVSCLAALVVHVPLPAVAAAAAAALLAGGAWAAADLWRTRRAWQAAPLRLERLLPAALALGVEHTVRARLVNPAPRAWRVALFDHVDPDLAVEGLPQHLVAASNAATELAYIVRPRRRGLVRFEPAQLRLRSLGGSLELLLRVGEAASLRVYPNFAAVSRYAWLAGDRRLSDIGIKSTVQRGAGTDFKQLAEYRSGASIRHIDWKATLKLRRPIVREFQDDRDQCVFFLLDCGRRMRAEEGSEAAPGGSHFDEALNALMLLAYVALKEGDEVGAMTFGTEPGERRSFAPRKGAATLNALMGTLYHIQPQATHADYLLAARDLMQAHGKRALVVVLTNFRDEDAAELEPALRLLRSRHLVLLASLRERALRTMAEQPLATGQQAAEVAGAHLFMQARRDAFQRLAGRDALLIDVEPVHLAVELVNRYRAVKRAGLL